jgi:hypothetical protein
VDQLHYVLTASRSFSRGIFLTIFYFMMKYRRRSPDERPKALSTAPFRSK